MDEYFTFSTILIENKIPVASLLLSGTIEARGAGDDFLTKRAGANTGFWLVDTEKSSLGSLMRVSSFPTVVLVSDKGEILFNGDPGDRRLWQTLKLLNPEITQPTIYAVQSKTDSKSTSPEKKWPITPEIFDQKHVRLNLNYGPVFGFLIKTNPLDHSVQLRRTISSRTSRPRHSME